MAYFRCGGGKKKKKRLMYFKHNWNSNINPAGVSGNNFITYDASILPNYEKLTVDNFEFVIKSVQGDGSNNGSSTKGFTSTFPKTYDQSTGIFTMGTTGATGNWQGVCMMEGYLYLVEPITEEILPIKCSLSHTTSNTSTTGGIRWVNSCWVSESHTKLRLENVIIGTSSNEDYNTFKVRAYKSNDAEIGDVVVAKHSNLHLNEYIDLPEGTAYLRSIIQIYSGSSITTSGSFIVE